jgi:hypothetical protein
VREWRRGSRHNSVKKRKQAGYLGFFFFFFFFFLMFESLCQEEE